MNGIESITQERIEQIEKHGRTVKWDVEQNKSGQLIKAAILLMQADTPYQRLEYIIDIKPRFWDEGAWVRMCRQSERKRLIIAGALLAAEIDRLDYIEQQKEKV